MKGDGFTVGGTRFVSFAQSVLYRGAGLDILWSKLLAVGLVVMCLSDLVDFAIEEQAALAASGPQLIDNHSLVRAEVHMNGWKRKAAERLKLVADVLRRLSAEGLSLNAMAGKLNAMDIGASR